MYLVSYHHVSYMTITIYHSEISVVIIKKIFPLMFLNQTDLIFYFSKNYSIVKSIQ